MSAGKVSCARSAAGFEKSVQLDARRLLRPCRVILEGQSERSGRGRELARAGTRSGLSASTSGWARSKVDVSVRWPQDATGTFKDVAANPWVAAREGRGIVERHALKALAGASFPK